MNKWIVGIDLGLNGAISSMTEKGDITTLPMPIVGKHIDWDELCRLLKPFSYEYQKDKGILVFEKLGQIFQSSKATAMSMGRQSEGMIVMCKCLGIPYREVPPKEWQAEMFKGIDKIYKGNKLDTKAMALEKIKQIYPKLKLTFGERAIKPHDGLIDSVLLCEYAMKL